MFVCQGISTAGHQLGMRDGRSSLIREIFRIYDFLPRASDAWRGHKPDFIFAGQCRADVEQCRSISFLLRRGLVLENVGALLSSQNNCRMVFNYVEKDPAEFVHIMKEVPLSPNLSPGAVSIWISNFMCLMVGFQVNS